jgi:hypothetical protein
MKLLVLKKAHRVKKNISLIRGVGKNAPNILKEILKQQLQIKMGY